MPDDGRTRELTDAAIDGSRFKNAVKRLRAKLRRAATGSQPITTIRGVGYKLEA